MKKSLLALAVLGAFAGAAQAQTSVTIYGSIDGGVRYVNHADAAGNKKISVSSNGTYNSNRLGFKGVEDLGGGMNAHFNLETGFNIGTGTDDTNSGQFWNRTASVGIGGNWGALDIGHMYSIAFKTMTAYDPFQSKYTGIIPIAGVAAGSNKSSSNPIGSGSTRFNNDIQYTGTFGPVTARAEYSLGEVAGGVSTGSAAAVGAMYANGPLTAGGAYTRRKTTGFGGAALADSTTGASFQNNQWTVGAAYTFGPARIAAGYMDEKQDLAAGGENHIKQPWVGGSYAITPAFNLAAGYYQQKGGMTAAGADGKRQLFIVGTTYALSKRTNFYADVDYNKYTDAAVTTFKQGDKATGVSVGINHVF